MQEWKASSPHEQFRSRVQAQENGTIHEKSMHTVHSQEAEAACPPSGDQVGEQCVHRPWGYYSAIK